MNSFPKAKVGERGDERRPIAYVSPFFNDNNDYIEIQKQLLAALSFDVRRLRHAVTSWEIRELFDRRNAICFHWPELKAVEAGRGLNGFQPLGFLGWLFYLLIAAVARARVCYYVHDHSVHDTRGVLKRFSSLLIRAFCSVSDIRIVHDPRSARMYDARYVPHPLYYEFVGAGRPSGRRSSVGAVRFGILGSVRPYKRIDEILRYWPKGKPLLIAGWARPEFATRVARVIAERDLAECVETRLQFLERGDFDAALDAIDVLVLPHASETALVSGAVFEAVGRVPAMIVRRSPFTEYLAQNVPGVVLFQREPEISQAVERAEALVKLLPEAPAAEARQLFGAERIRDTLGSVLAQPRDTEVAV